jgi:galactokinase
MIDRANAMLLEFKELYGAADDVGLARAPGRVNIIGEHTDYNDGYVLPIAIARDTMAAFKANGTRRLRVRSMNLGASVEMNLDADEMPAEPTWMAYVGGVARVLASKGVDLVGTDLVLHTTLPVGGGLSSSAALEVSAALALTSAAGADVPRRDLALACQEAETEYAGMRCGIMDQYAALFGEAGMAVELDCRAVRHELVPCATDTAKFVVCDTGVKHELASSEYNHRREECERAAAEAARALSGENIRSLRDLVPGDLSAVQMELDATLFKRVRHVVTENGRVVEAARALAERNYVALGVLMDASHESLRDDYEVSSPELDMMVDLAWSQTGVYGSRMTGGGFGGCTISLVDAEHVDAFCEHVATTYRDRTGRTPSLYVCSPEKGAEIVRRAG